MDDYQSAKQPYNENFYRAIKSGSLKSASIILPIVEKFIHPQSVIDIGCGVGTWLAVWKNFWNVEICGLDGDYVDRTQLMIDDKDFNPTNLETDFIGGGGGRKFDLVESLEVAEHLSPARADSFVEDLTKLGDVILFSAAIVGQGGVNHVNEQMQSYWAQKFLHFGYVGVDCLRPEIWDNKQVEVWYRQNILFYVNSKELYRYPLLQKYYLETAENVIYDMVHPELWINRLIHFQNTAQKFNALLAQITQKK